jgi:hypothetical protein
MPDSVGSEYVLHSCISRNKAGDVQFNVLDYVLTPEKEPSQKRQGGQRDKGM